MSNVNKVDKELLSDEDLMKVDGGRIILKPNATPLINEDATPQSSFKKLP
jgi:hypothetical protein